CASLLDPRVASW
nr:immunoglobulin heavy chain junction region [Macaca mulatta]